MTHKHIHDIGDSRQHEDEPGRRTFSLLREIQRFDQRRPSLPGEHWVVFGAALALLRMASQSRSRMRALVAATAGAALAWRALSGRDGPLRGRPASASSGKATT